jgi:prevent-host-death family protein
MLAAKGRRSTTTIRVIFQSYHPAIPLTVAYSDILAKTGHNNTGNKMKVLTAKDAKYGFGGLIDPARAGPVAVAKHGRPIVVVMAVKEFERLTSGRSKKADGAEGKEQK